MREAHELTQEDVARLLKVNRGAVGGEPAGGYAWLVDQWENGAPVLKEDLDNGGGPDGLLSLRRLYGLLRMDKDQWPPAFADVEPNEDGHLTPVRIGEVDC